MPEHELPKTYKPAEHEDRAWRAWLDTGAFHADPARVLRGEARPYCIVIPPPNVTDRLHLGHGLNNTLQDILARAHRMRGFETLWMPGTDHAGIATQAVVERRVLKDEGKRRHDFAREDFIAKIQAFKDEYEATITAQLQKMGCSCDWDRQRFTMDEVCAAAVREAFFRLFRDGLIYRGKRLVNWDPALQTAVADDECYDEEIDAHFYYLRYPLVHAHGSPTAKERRQHKEPEDAVPVTWDELLARGYPGAEEHPADDQAWITVATTRPETYLGDTAVAVNPNDPRAKALRGLSVELPLVGRVIPIVEDDYVVLPKHLARTEDEANDPKAQFATGFLKVTPAHDPNDYEIGQRHQLPMVNVFAPDARISSEHGWTDVRDAHLFLGLPREKARKRVIEEFKARTVGNRSLLEDVKPYRHSVKHSDRSKSVIEPYLSDQWYVRVTDPRLAAAANEALTPEQRGSGSATPARGTGVPPVTTSSLPSSSPPFNSSSSKLTIQPDSNIRPFTKTIHTHLHISARHLPHWQFGGSTDFVTFRARRILTESERDQVLAACKHWDGDRVELHAACVMPDRVHLIVSRFERSPGEWYSLTEVLHSIKSFTAHQIGPIWQDESFDRIIREDEYADVVRYVAMNPEEAGLGAWNSYAWLWLPEETLRGETRFAARWRAGSDRRDACPTSPGSEGKDTDTSLRFYPARYAKTYEQWHDNIRDWCISRQLWWGHRIPVWSKLCTTPAEGSEAFHELDQLLRKDILEDILVAQGEVTAVRFVDANNGQEFFPTVEEFNHGFARPVLIYLCLLHDKGTSEALERYGWTRDPDVLDTWFSSALWPMSTMGWPDPDRAASIESDPTLRDLLRAFNPTTTLCTAREIITLWVSRMVMFNRYFMGDGQGRGPAPFRNVFIHAIVQDGEGRKMSKSLGNGVDPLDIIASHGSDAMRFTLCKMSTQTQDVRMPVVKGPDGRNTSPKFDEGRNFCNKLWNAARFALAQLSAPAETGTPAGELALIDRWMLSRLHAAIGACDAALADFEFANYAQAVYDLLWRDFCDWYLEGIKPTVAASPRQQAVLAHALEVVVRLLHPITPFVTETIWERVREVKTLPIAGLTLAPSRKGGTLCTAGWPIAEPSLHDPDAEASFERLRGLITAVREARASLNVPPKRKIVLHAPDDARRWMAAAPGLVESLAGLERVEGMPAGKPAGSAEVRFESLAMLISNLADAVDADAEKARLSKLVTDLDKSITTLEGRLANPGYADKAPAHMVQQTRDQLAKAIGERDAARAALAGLG